MKENLVKCKCCKKKSELFKGSEYCKECYDIVAEKIKRVVEKNRKAEK